MILKIFDVLSLLDIELKMTKLIEALIILKNEESIAKEAGMETF